MTRPLSSEFTSSISIRGPATLTSVEFLLLLAQLTEEFGDQTVQTLDQLVFLFEHEDLVDQVDEGALEKLEVAAHYLQQLLGLCRLHRLVKVFQHLSDHLIHLGIHFLLLVVGIGTDPL